MTAVKCGAARRLAWGDPDRLVTSVDRARALSHIGKCGSCRRFVADMKTLREVAGSCGSTAIASPDLHRRVRAALRQEPARRIAVRRSYRLGLGLAAALAATALGARLLIPFTSDPLRRLANAEARLLSLPGIESSDAASVHAWLAARLAFPVHVPTFPDARLTGAAVTTVDGHQAAVIRFQVGDRHVVYVMSPDGIPIERSGLDPIQHQTQYGALAVVSWRVPGLLHAWIGSLPPPHLASLARRCAEQARAARLSMVSRRPPIVA